jgi:hypothetical protein
MVYDPGTRGNLAGGSEFSKHAGEQTPEARAIGPVSRC